MIWQRAVAYFGLVVGILIVGISLLKGLNQEFVGAAIAVGSGFALIARTRSVPETLKIGTAARPWVLASIALSLAGLAIAFYNPAPRPMLSFGFWLLASICLLSACLVPGRKLTTVACGTMVLSICITAPVYWARHGYYGVDPWFHATVADLVAQTGHVPTDTRYAAFPGMHILVAIAQIVSSSDIKAALYVIPVMHLICIPLVMLVGKRLFGPSAGAIAGLLLGLSNFFLYWSFWAASTTFGVTLFSVLFLLTSYLFFEIDWRVTLLWFVVAICLVFTHSLSSFVALCVLAFAMLFWLVQHQDQTRVLLALILGFALILILQWFYAFYAGQTLFGFAVTTINRVLQGDTAGVAEVSSSGTRAWIPNFLDNLGYGILFMFAVNGVLRLLRERPRTMPFAAMAMFPFAITYGAGILGVNAILPHRWIAFGLVTATPIAAWSLHSVISLRWGKVISLVLFVLIVGTMVLNTWANPENPILNPANAERYDYLDSEIAIKSFSQAHVAFAHADYWFSNSVLYHNTSPISSLNARGLLILRQYVSDTALTVPVGNGYYVSRHVSIPNSTWSHWVDGNRLYDDSTTFLVDVN